MQTSTLVPIFAVVLVAASLRAETVGAYWAFQTGPADPESTVFSEAVSYETLPGTPAFARTGDELFNFTNFGADFTNFNGDLWLRGRSTTWGANAGASSNNTFQITIDTTGSENFSVRFKYRNNGLASGGLLITAFSSFDYRVGAGGSFQPVPGIDLTLLNDSNYDNLWTANLSALDGIEDAGEVTLRWTIPDYDQVASSQLRVDDLQITGILKSTEPPVDPLRDRLLPEGNYNVLFIPIDDLRPLLNIYGETEPLRPSTPNLDRLASTGMVFTNAHCQQAVCNASRASLLTGLRPDTTRCWKLQTFFRDIHANVITLPQHFGAQGYSAHGVGKIYHSTNYANQDGPLSWNDGWSSSSTGFTWYESAKAAAEDGGNNKISATDAGEVDRGGSPITDEAYNDGFAAAQGVAKIASYAAAYQSGGTPFFLAVGFQKPHLPFNCPKAYWDLYDPGQIDLAGYDGGQTMPAGTNEFTSPYGGEPAAFDDVTGHPVTGMPTEPEARHLIHGYLACVSFIDAQVGKLLDALEDPDGIPGTDDSIVDNTIIVVWGDHGFHLGDHNGFWAKHSNYETATRVPLIVSAPGMADLGSAGTFCSAPVELVDVFPTLVDYCSLPAPDQPTGLDLQGTSFLPLLEDPAQPWKMCAFSQYQRTINDNGASDVPVGNNGPGMGYSIRTARHRYTEWWRTASTDDTLDLHVLTGSAPEHVELYDYLADPGETVNLAGQPAYASLVAELAACLNDADGTFAGDGWHLAAVDAPVEFPLDYGSWRTRHEGPGVAAAALDPAGDPDGDGLWNLFEYKFGTHPLEADLSPITSDLGPGGYGLTFPDVTTRTDATLAPTTSPDLTSGSWTSTGVTLDHDLGARGNATLRSGSIPTVQDRGFLRLEATLVP